MAKITKFRLHKLTGRGGHRDHAGDGRNRFDVFHEREHHAAVDDHAEQLRVEHGGERVHDLVGDGIVRAQLLHARTLLVRNAGEGQFAADQERRVVDEERLE